MKFLSARYSVVCLQVFSLYCWSFTDGHTRGNQPRNNPSEGAKPLLRPTGRTELSRSTLPTITKTSTTTSTPTVYCNRSISTGCPDGWFPVDEDSCLYLSRDSLPAYRLDQKCYSVGGSLLNETFYTASVKSCLKKLLPPTTYYSRNNNLIFFSTARLMDVFSDTIYTDISYRRGFQACITRKNDKDSLAVASFNLHITDPIQGTNRTIDLLQINDTFVTVEESEDILNFVCQSNQDVSTYLASHIPGNPYLSLGLYYYSFVGSITSATCDHSGLYSCVTNNGFHTVRVDKEIRIKHSIEFLSFTVQKISRHSWMDDDDDDDDDNINILENFLISCSVRACPPPKMISINDWRQLEIVNLRGNTSISYLLTKITCADMGQYTCKAEAENGDVLVHTSDLIIQHRCPPQLCRGETTSKIIFAAIGQTVNISVCLNSFESLFVQGKSPTNSRILVKLTRGVNSKTAFMAAMSIIDLRAEDYGSYIIQITNINGDLNFNLTIMTPGTPLKTTSPGRDDVTQQGHLSTAGVGLSLTSRGPGYPIPEDKVTTKSTQTNQISPGPAFQANQEKVAVEDAPHSITSQGQLNRPPPESTHSFMVSGLLVSINIILVAIFVVMIYVNRERIMATFRFCNKARTSYYQNLGKGNGHHVNDAFLGVQQDDVTQI